MGADCSPGFYKNHVPVWDDIDGNCDDGPGRGPGNNSGCGPFPEFERNCCEDAECTAEVLADLNDKSPEGEGEAIRNAAKAFLDACFGEDAPCDDEEEEEEEEYEDD